MRFLAWFLVIEREEPHDNKGPLDRGTRDQGTKEQGTKRSKDRGTRDQLGTNGPRDQCIKGCVVPYVFSYDYILVRKYKEQQDDEATREGRNQRTKRQRDKWS